MLRPRPYPPAYPLAPSTGLLLPPRALASVATCRVGTATRPVVEVEGAEAPGMRPGARIELCIAAARALERLRSISAMTGRESGATVRTIAHPAA